MNFDEISRQTIALALDTGKLIRKERESFSKHKIIEKGSNDFVTSIDKASEEHLVKGLSQIIDGCGFIAEEGTAGKSNEEFVWIIDPIDGTTNFIHGAPPYSISIGLQRNGELIGGLIYEISADECFYAFNGGKAYLNDKEIRVSSIPNVKKSLLATGFPYSDFGRMEPFMETMTYFFHHSHGVRRLGSAAADLAYVACGRYDGFYEYNLNAWDVAGGAYIVQQAGGKIGDFHGKNNYLFGKELIAANAEIYDELLQVIGNIMN